MGISTSCFLARESVAAVVRTPSATIRVLPTISASLWPWPSWTPTDRLRLSSPVQVNSKSPIPASPPSVSRFPPQATASRVISDKPLVTRAASELNPNPRPEQTPAAMAMTFFTAPPSSTPATSVLVYNLKEALENSC